MGPPRRGWRDDGIKGGSQAGSHEDLMKGIWKAALATSGLAVAALLLWLLSPPLPDKATESAIRSAQQSPSQDHSGIATPHPPTSVLVSELNPNVHVGNDGLVFELSAKAMTGRATVDFTDRS